jgi:transposase
MGCRLRIQNTLGRSACEGAAYGFRNRRGNRIKLLVWDGNGVWLCQRRLHRGQFNWPRADTPAYSLTLAQWQWLVRGADWQRLQVSLPAH